jgi:hypothetical protein
MLLESSATRLSERNLRSYATVKCARSLTEEHACNEWWVWKQNSSVGRTTSPSIAAWETWLSALAAFAFVHLWISSSATLLLPRNGGLKRGSDLQDSSMCTSLSTDKIAYPAFPATSINLQPEDDSFHESRCIPMWEYLPASPKTNALCHKICPCALPASFGSTLRFWIRSFAILPIFCSLSG